MIIINAKFEQKYIRQLRINEGNYLILCHKFLNESDEY